MFVPRPVSYSISDDDEVGLLAEKLGFLPAAALGHFIRSLKQPGVNQFIPVSGLTGDGWYVPVCCNVRKIAKKGPDITLKLARSPAVWLPQIQFFANALLFGDAHPSERIANCGWVAHAFETDNKDYQAGLAEQFMWAVTYENEPAALTVLANLLRKQFRDFRRLQQVGRETRARTCFCGSTHAGCRRQSYWIAIMIVPTTHRSPMSHANTSEMDSQRIGIG
jgi:hypothetical protein